MHPIRIRSRIAFDYTRLTYLARRHVVVGETRYVAGDPIDFRECPDAVPYRHLAAMCRIGAISPPESDAEDALFDENGVGTLELRQTAVACGLES